MSAAWHAAWRDWELSHRGAIMKPGSCRAAWDCRAAWELSCSMGAVAQPGSCRAARELPCSLGAVMQPGSCRAAWLPRPHSARAGWKLSRDDANLSSELQNRSPLHKYLLEASGGSQPTQKQGWRLFFFLFFFTKQLPTTKEQCQITTQETTT